MANKVYNLNGGLYSGDAFTAFETRIASSNNGSIVASPSDLKVSAGSGMNVTVSTGAGIIGNGTLSGVRFAIDAPVTVAVNAASTANPRMDSVVAYIDKSVSASTSVVDNTDLGIIKFKSVAGTPASAPTAPSTATIQSSIGAGNPYMVLANVTVPKSSTAASSFTITDTRVTPTSAIITDNSITTPKLANKAVTSDKVDWTTLPYYFTSSTTNKTLTTSYQNILSLKISEGGVYYISAYAGVFRTSGMEQSDFQYQVTGGNPTLYTIFTMYDGGGYPSAHCSGIVTIPAGTTINFVAKTGSGNITARIEYWHNLSAIKIAEV